MEDEHTPYYRTLASESSRVRIVTSLQRLRIEALIPVPPDCEVRSVIKFFKKQLRWMLSAGVVLLHDTLGHSRLDGQNISYRSSAGRCLIIHSVVRTSRPVISNFSYTLSNSCPASVSVFRMTERWRWVSHFRITHRLGRPYYVWEEYLCSVVGSWG